MEDFLLPVSKVLLDKREGRLSDITQGHVVAICQSTNTINAAYDLLVALCTGCIQNLELVSNSLSNMFHFGMSFLPVYVLSICPTNICVFISLLITWKLLSCCLYAISSLFLFYLQNTN